MENILENCPTTSKTRSSSTRNIHIYERVELIPMANYRIKQCKALHTTSWFENFTRCKLSRFQTTNEWCSNSSNTNDYCIFNLPTSLCKRIDPGRREGVEGLLLG